MLSQYSNSPKYVTLYNGLTNLFSNAKTISDWYNVVYNLKTAMGYGLDIWGEILNVGRSFSYYNESTQQYEQIYLQGAQTIDGVSYTADEIEEKYRLILFMKAMANITNATLRSLNDLLMFYFVDRGKCYCIQYDTMEIRVVFEFYVDKLEKAIFSTDIFPKPTGVLLNFEYIPLHEYFGFFVSGLSAANQPYAPFNQKPFYR